MAMLEMWHLSSHLERMGDANCKQCSNHFLMTSLSSLPLCLAVSQESR